MAAKPYPHVPKDGGGDYTSIKTVGLNFLQASHDAHGAIQRGLNAFYAEELNNIDGLFYKVTTDRDNVAGDAMASLYTKITELVTTNADQTPVATHGMISVIARHWRLKYEFSPGVVA